MSEIIGILAHVDSGKTTLSEAILYLTGEIRSPGRVDKRNSFLDTDKIERERGITVFSKQANFKINNSPFTLLDTPGHADFSAEAERTLRVLDCAVLVVSGADKVQSHTETIWRLLKRYSLPAFIFVNKTDISPYSKEEIMSDIRAKLDGGCIDFSAPFTPEFYENAACCDERLFELFEENGTLSDEALAQSVARRSIFPCFFGSALKLDGVSEFLDGLEKFSLRPTYGEDFAAKVFKITEDERKCRLTHMKITGGTLKVKDSIADEKVNEIRVYSGEKYKSPGAVGAGEICTVTGLTETYPGQGLGLESDSPALSLSPVFSYCVLLPEGSDTSAAFRDLKKLSEEESELNIVQNERSGEIEVQLMGEVQLEVLKSLIASRFNLDVEFSRGKVIYKETIADTVEGVGHYEPLRHYAEVHLKMEPAERGAGLLFSSECPEEVLEKNFQRLVLTHLAEKTHLGVLTGSPITDMKITLVSGRAHLKHTEGGDFRQATYRAVRQGLMKAKSVLLEPWYNFSVTLPSSAVGRAMTDFDRMGAQIEPPEAVDFSVSVLRGSAPFSRLHGYDTTLTSYTKGLGRLVCSFGFYAPSPDQEKIVSECGYDPEGDVYNSPDSVFCSQGAGFTVKWYEVEKHMHLALKKAPSAAARQSVRGGKGSAADEEELLRIFEQTYGPIRRRTYSPMKTIPDTPEKKRRARPTPEGPDFLLIDGYNIIFAWDDLKKIAASSLEEARQKLIERAAAYFAVRGCEIILVFDAYKVKGNHGSVEKVGGMSVVYTKEAETADSYIERTAHDLSKKHRVTVATSDNLEQMIILGSGALRISASEFLSEVESAEREISEFVALNNIKNKSLDNKVLTRALIKRLSEEL